MCGVKVTLSSALARFVANERNFTVPSGTVTEVLDWIHARHPALRQRLLDESGNVLPFISIYVGEDNIRDLSSQDVTVAPSATVLIMSAVAGG
jgi:molybdopterin converting factor small subunit